LAFEALLAILVEAFAVRAGALGDLRAAFAARRGALRGSAILREDFFLVVFLAAMVAASLAHALFVYAVRSRVEIGSFAAESTLVDPV
jgi:hypothetical protein